MASEVQSIAFHLLPVKINLNISGDPIPQKHVVRILGIFFDSRLTFRAHVDQVIQGCKNNLSWFHRLVWKPGLSNGWRRTVYYALVRSKLTYGCVALSAMSKQQKQRLQVVQNNCLRAILNVHLADRISVAKLHDRCKIPPLSIFAARSQRRYLQNAVNFVMPLREDIESVRIVGATKGPIAQLACLQGDEPLPPLPI